MRSTALRALLALLVVSVGALLIARLAAPAAQVAGESATPGGAGQGQAPVEPGPNAPGPDVPAPGASPPAPPGAPAGKAEGPAREQAWNEERIAGWLGESSLATWLMWVLKVGLIVVGVGCLVNELLKADRARHARTPSGWGPWSAPGIAWGPIFGDQRAPKGSSPLWPTVVAEPMAALALGVLFPLGVQLVLTGLFPPGRRPVGNLEFGIAAVTLALLPPALVTVLRRRRLGARLLPPAGSAILLGLKFACIATLIVVPVQLLWALLLVHSGQRLEVQNVVQIFADPASPAQPWLIAVFGVLVAPFTEEAVFRGLLYPALRARAPGGPFGAAVIVALLFALIHGNMMAFVPLFTLALVLAWVMERTNSLLACVVVHAVHNAASLAPMVARLLQGGPSGGAS